MGEDEMSDLNWSKASQIDKIFVKLNVTIEEHGAEEFRRMLMEYFGLENEEAVSIMKSIRTIRNAEFLKCGYSAIPEEWYFKVKDPERDKGGPRITKPKKAASRKGADRIAKPKKVAPRKGADRITTIKKQWSYIILKEYKDIYSTIKTLRRLPDKLRSEARKKWPDKYRPFMSGPRKGGKQEKYFPSRIAYWILADRWGIQEETVRKYVSEQKNKK